VRVPDRLFTLSLLWLGLLGILEPRRRNEHSLLANFGTSPAVLGTVCAAPAVLAELLVGLTARG
jgi:hypothetical protein